MSLTTTYDSQLARVRIAVSAATTPGTSYVVVQRRDPGGQRWTTVRGGASLVPAAGAVAVDDYEFEPDVLSTYRAVSYSAVNVALLTQTGTITPTIGGVWFKSVARPYLNRQVILQEYSAVQRKSRAGVFDIDGRTMPVVVSGVASSRRWTYTVLTRAADDAHALDLLLASGDVLHVQVPPAYDIPAGYVSIGDTDVSRFSRPLSDERRLFGIPVTECASPGPDVVGSTATWSGLLAAYGTWTAVLAAFSTWQDVLDYVAAAETVIVP